MAGNLLKRDTTTRLLSSLLLASVLLAASPTRTLAPPSAVSDTPRVATPHRSTVSIPFSVSLLRAQSALAHSAFMNTTDSYWVKVDCRPATRASKVAGFACGLYVSPVGQFVGGNDEYRYVIAPDRSSLALRTVPDPSGAIAFGIDVNVGYSVRLRGMRGVQSCGDPARDVNPATKKKDYLHFHVHETVRLHPTAEFGLRATFVHTLVPDARCSLRVLLPVDTDITNAIGGIESKALAAGETQLARKLAASAPQLHEAASAAWRSIQKPYPVPQQRAIYVLLRPVSLALLPFEADGRGDRLTVRGTLRVGVSPQVVSSGAVPRELVPLPRFHAVPHAPQRDRILANATLGYSVANAIVRKRMVGRRVGTQLFRPIAITKVTVYPTTVAGAAKLAVRIDYRGAVRGSLYAWGTPTFDAVHRSISIPDLQVTPGKKGIVGRLATPLLQQAKLLQTVRTETANELTAQFRALDAALMGTYARTVADGVSVRGAIHGVSLQAVAPARPGITAEFTVSGYVRCDAVFDAARYLEEPRVALRAARSLR